MVSSKEEGLVYNIKLSSVGPGRMTGQDVIHQPTGSDLAMKLHYLRTVYYFGSQALEGLSIIKIKEPMFTWLNHFYWTCGRFRRSDSGRPYIKCNDCGVRFIEAQCDKTVDEWLEMKDPSLEKLLVSNQVIGPELPFSPLVLLQLTKFKCGGSSMGLSWAHVLGDAFSAVEFMNLLGRTMSTPQPARPLSVAQQQTKTAASLVPLKATIDPLSVKRVGPVGDHWIAPNSCKMESLRFNVTASQLSQLQSKVCGPADENQIPPFQLLSAILWQSIAKVRDGLGLEPKLVTICKNTSHRQNKGSLSSGQVISIVRADFSVMGSSPKELSSLISKEAVDEQRKIDEAMERDPGSTDFIVYGANLTFVDLTEPKFYGLDLRGQRPIYVSCTIDGIGDEGVVLVQPEPNNGGEDNGGGKIVTIILQEKEVSELKSQLKSEWSIA